MDKYRFVFVFSVLLVLLPIVILWGCKDRFVELSASDFKVRWDDSIKHSAVSWWYLGEKEGYHYILEKWPLKQDGYKVSKEHVVIHLGQPKKLTFIESDWINLKTGLIDFK